MDPFTLTCNPSPTPVLRPGSVVWTLHLRTERGAEPALWDAVRRTGCENLTGEAVGGDSWREWCEHAGPGIDTALHVYLVAPTRLRALNATGALLGRLGIDPLDEFDNAYLTTAADWSETDQ